MRNPRFVLYIEESRPQLLLLSMPALVDDLCIGPVCRSSIPGFMVEADLNSYSDEQVLGVSLALECR